MGEARGNQDIPPVHLRNLNVTVELRQITVTQLEDCETDALETSCSGVDPKGQVVCALRGQELSGRLTIRAIEDRVETPHSLGTQGNGGHGA